MYLLLQKNILWQYFFLQLFQCVHIFCLQSLQTKRTHETINGILHSHLIFYLIWWQSWSAILHHFRICCCRSWQHTFCLCCSWHSLIRLYISVPVVMHVAALCHIWSSAFILGESRCSSVWFSILQNSGHLLNWSAIQRWNFCLEAWPHAWSLHVRYVCKRI